MIEKIFDHFATPDEVYDYLMFCNESGVEAVADFDGNKIYSKDVRTVDDVYMTLYGQDKANFMTDANLILRELSGRQSGISYTYKKNK